MKSDNEIAMESWIEGILEEINKIKFYINLIDWL